MRKHTTAIIIGAGLVFYETANAGEKLETSPIFVSESVSAHRSRLMDSPHIHEETQPISIDITDSIGVYGNRVEGSLDAFWENHFEPNASPVFKLHFLRYASFRHGAQQPKVSEGFGTLAVYLSEIGFTTDDIMRCIKQLVEKKSISLPNVMLPEQLLAAYEPQP
jgi:hypothetical protein